MEQTRKKKLLLFSKATGAILGVVLGVIVGGLSYMYVYLKNHSTKPDPISISQEEFPVISKQELKKSKVVFTAKLDSQADLGDRAVSSSNGDKLMLTCYFKTVVARTLEEQRELEGMIMKSHESITKVRVGKFGIAVEKFDPPGNVKFWEWSDVWPSTKDTIDNWLVAHQKK
jgi:hypothetical protein